MIDRNARNVTRRIDGLNHVWALRILQMDKEELHKLAKSIDKEMTRKYPLNNSKKN